MPAARSIKICSCNKTIPVAPEDIARGLDGAGALRFHTQLCRREIGEFEATLRSERELTVGCTQESALFSEVAEGIDPEARLRFVNIRETAGWSAEGAKAAPKIAALLAAARLPDPEPVPTVSYSSAGALLIIGQAGVALEWATRLAAQLDVTVLLTGVTGGARLPIDRNFPVYSGRVTKLQGYLGSFEVSWQQDNAVDLDLCTRCGACVRACPEGAIDLTFQVDAQRCKSHRDCVSACGEIGAIDFERAERSRSDRFDMVMDLSDRPAIALHQPPQGYFAPGRDPLDQALAVQQLLQMVGEFEKPKFFVYRENICAHARSRITGCTKCLEVCSTSAISEDGDRIRVEPHLCMGCGGCATVCPSGALTYAYPRVADLGLRLKTMLQAYARAGGRDACLLFHNPTDGRELIGRLAREGKGLPARVIPVEVFHVGSVGVDLMLGAIALGASQVLVLSTGSEAPDYLAASREQMDLGETVLNALGYGGRHFALLEDAEPARLERSLWDMAPAQGCEPATFRLGNDKRATLEFVFEHLARRAPSPREVVPLAAGAPYGSVEVDRAACTLCMACAGACPEKALLDGKDYPRLKFIEANCVQCGLCRKTCPENAISLAPRLLLGREAREERVLHEAEPYLCIRCGKPYATRQMVENMLGKLGGHSMFGEPGSLDRLKMCADCRVVDMVANEKSMSIFDAR